LIKGEFNKALADCNEAIRLNMKDAFFYGLRSQVYFFKHDYDKALADFDEAIRLDPKNAIRYRARGLAYDSKKDYDKALADFNEAIRLDPNVSDVYVHRGSLHYSRKEFDKAAADWRRSIQLEQQKDSWCYDSLAWLLATCPKAEVRDGKEAIEYARKACEMTRWHAPGIIETLAAAYAEAGDFKQAVRWQTKAVDMKAPDQDQKKKMEARRALYKEGKPYREQ
jgi:tetratricopeptide (TPR) repeat protein